ncbi:hypothetical protein ACGF5F_00505 [Streptomyces sp. NPDC047821]|uniref:hypothetical protein n=1 Tax=unclassified Streptomyces TaxID=2593676 RepID=UPI00363465CF
MTTATVLPSIGAEIPCSCYAANVPLKVRTALVNVEFKGGIKVRVETHPDQPPHKAVVLKVIGHKVEADHPELGRITIEQENMEATPDSLLKIVQHFPPKLSATMFLSFKLTIERPPGSEGAGAMAAREPLVLRTKEPAKLLSPELSKFPPDGDFYRLENPIKLVHPDTDQVVATIDKFPVRVGG